MAAHFRRRKMCYFTANKISKIDYKDVYLLRKFINSSLPARGGIELVHFSIVFKSKYGLK